MLIGQKVTEHYGGTATVIGAVLDSAQDSSVLISPVLSASAPAGGPVTRSCIDRLSNLLVEEITRNDSEFDGILLELSGTLTTTDATSGDEEVVRALRNAFPDLPVVVTLPLEANVTSGLVESCNQIISPITIDGERRSRIIDESISALKRAAEGNRSVYPVHKQLPILIPVAAQRPYRSPVRDVLEMIDAIHAKSDTTQVSLCCGYPYADVHDAGASVTVYSENPETGRKTAGDLAREIWDRRGDFFVDGNNIEEAVHNAMASKDGPVLIADLGDNPDDGAPGDGTTVLWALLDLGVRSATLGAIADEQAVAACVRAGIGATVEIPVGGRIDTRHGYPIDVRGTVVSTREGSFTLNGPVNTGLRVDPGNAVVISIEARHEGSVEVILTEKPVQITDTSLFEHVGIEAASRKIISIKSTNDYRPAFELLATAIYEVITPGITTPDPAFYNFQHVRRPIYPLDAM